MGTKNSIKFSFFGLILLCISQKIVANERLDYFLQQHPEVSQFIRLLRTSRSLKSAIEWKRGTLFVPTNDAVDTYLGYNRGKGPKWHKSITNNTLLYHFCNLAMTSNELEQERWISTELPGNSPIWITKSPKGLFMNNAKLLSGDFRVIFVPSEEESKITIVHIIDQVLEPTIPSPVETSKHLNNPDAGRFLEHMSNYEAAADHQLSTEYRTIVQKQSRLDLYKTLSYQTFFIPVDEAFRGRNQKVNLRGIEDKVIFGHIIPKTGVFLRAISEDEEFETYRPSESPTQDPANVKGHSPRPFTTIITFEKARVDGREIWLVNSDNRHGDATNRKGIVQAEIIKGNIPVKNGVVHLINKPLVVIHLNVYQTLEWYATKQRIKSMGKFYELLRRLQQFGHGEDMIYLLQRADEPGVTLFVPSNEAIENCEEIQQNRNNVTALVEILKTHILKQRISAEDMVEHSKMRRVPFQIYSALRGRKLLFSSVLKNGDRTIHVEGGGVNATVIHADFGATNGYIHIIDSILGLPDQTVQEKLQTHPMLQSTFHLWQKAKMEDRLNATQTLTFFAPSDRAWRNIQRTSDSAYHNLLHSDTESPILGPLLERHIIPNQSLGIEDLHGLSFETKTKVVSKGMKGNVTISIYPIRTIGDRGYVKVNESRTLLLKESIRTTTLDPTGEETRTRKGETGEDSHYYIYWDRMWAHVIRTNVRCTDGMIHIIDDVLMDSEEIIVARAPSLRFTISFILVLCLFISLF